MTTYTVILEEDPETGDLIMPIPAELLAEAKWYEGDTLEWSIQENGQIILHKKDTNENSI
jgi:antitoxin component of MazEF toxin-antitoxin module